MKLVLIRHGKSDWHSGKDDYNRPLNKRGLKDAPMMALRLKEMGIVPDRILTSPALRALTTARLMADVFQVEEVDEIPSLYLASGDDIIKTALHAIGKYDCVFVFGHNPGMSIASTRIRGVDTSMPTCSAVVLTLENKGGEFSLIDSSFLKPKES